MYLKKIRLQNIKCFEGVTLEFPHTGEDYSGWNVVLGENGLGKSSIMRAIAEMATSLHATSWLYDDEWVARLSNHGKMEATFLETRSDDPELRGAGSKRHPMGERKQLWMDVTIERLKTEWDLTTRRAKKTTRPAG